MTLVRVGRRQGRQGPFEATIRRATPLSPRSRTEWAEKVRASQARAARRREALRDEQAVTLWLRELSRQGR